ncbi:MAG: serine/threonine protein phosphatase [Phycisphaerales bacterium]|nr:MAG: serine/threonine protein phosphatase [Phycisphaerales bacterium]
MEHRVDAVLLAGDVVDDQGAYFEVLGPLQRAMERLEGIPVLAVAGNHDARVLPSLAQELPGLTVLGRDGRWQEHVLHTAVGEVAILGQSFRPDRPEDGGPAWSTRSPFQDPPPESRSDRLRIGLLHGDLDASSSRYAPFTSTQLRQFRADAWLLGHVHVPSVQGLGQRVPMGYLGSVCGLDPGETGPRGAWLVRCEPGRVRMEHLPLAPLAWMQGDVQASDATAQDLADRLRQAAGELARQVPNALAVGVRLRIVGQSEHWRQLHEAVGSLRTGQDAEPWTHQGRRVFLDRIEAAVTAPLPLEELAKERSAAGRVASLIVQLEQGQAGELVERACARFEELAGTPSLRLPDLGERTIPLPDARRVLIDEARLVLSELLAQRREEP